MANGFFSLQHPMLESKNVVDVILGKALNNLVIFKVLKINKMLQKYLLVAALLQWVLSYAWWQRVARFFWSFMDLQWGCFCSISSWTVKMYFSVEQMATDTTSSHIKDYHHKNARIKDVKIGFEPHSGDWAGWVENGGGVWRGVDICYTLPHVVFAGGIVSTHRLQHRI